MLDVFSRICRHFSTLNSTPLAHSSAVVACLFNFFFPILRPTCCLRIEKEKKKLGCPWLCLQRGIPLFKLEMVFAPRPSSSIPCFVCLGDALYNTAASVEEPLKKQRAGVLPSPFPILSSYLETQRYGAKNSDYMLKNMYWLLPLPAHVVRPFGPSFTCL